MNTLHSQIQIAADSYRAGSPGHVIASDDCHVLVRQLGAGIFIGFRGSATPQDWFSNIDRHQVAAAADIPGKVHRGFQDSLDVIWPQLIAHLTSQTPRPIYLSGHSRGGAHATLAAARLHAAGFDVAALHTYGSPRVGNKRFARYISKHISQVRRYSNESDPVPRLPRWGYKHVGQLWWRSGGQWRHKAGWARRLGAYLFARRWPFIGDAFNDHRLAHYVAAITS